MTEIDTSTEAVESLMKDVTPGPWERMPDSTNKVVPVAGLCLAHFPKGTPEPCAESNTQFLLVAYKLVKSLLAERDQLRDELDAAYAVIDALKNERNEAAKALSDVLSGIPVRNADEIIARASLSKKDKPNDH